MSLLDTRYGRPRLHLLIVADTHIDEKHPHPRVPMDLLAGAIGDSRDAKTSVDAFVIIGDTTSRGSDRNWEMTKEVFARAGRPAARTLIAIGNHDTWSDEGGETAIGRYLRYSAEITGEERGKTYFSTVINGVHLIFPGSESDKGCDAEISEEQFSWLREELDSAAGSGLPILVFCHQPLCGTHGLPRTSCRDESDTDPLDGGVGEDSPRLEKLLSEYVDVYYFSGHSHMGYAGEKRFAEEGYSSFETRGSLTLVNLPSLACGNHHCEEGQGKFGLGLQLEIYDDRIVLTPRDTENRCGLDRLSVSGGKPYLEKTF